MPVPKQRQTSASRDMRRAQHKIKAPGTSECPQCHATKLPHRVCPNCGYYKGTEVVETD